MQDGPRLSTPTGSTSAFPTTGSSSSVYWPHPLGDVIIIPYAKPETTSSTANLSLSHSSSAGSFQRKPKSGHQSPLLRSTLERARTASTGSMYGSFRSAGATPPSPSRLAAKVVADAHDGGTAGADPLGSGAMRAAGVARVKTSGVVTHRDATVIKSAVMTSPTRPRHASDPQDSDWAFVPSNVPTVDTHVSSHHSPSGNNGSHPSLAAAAATRDFVRNFLQTAAPPAPTAAPTTPAPDLDKSALLKSMTSTVVQAVTPHAVTSPTYSHAPVLAPATTAAVDATAQVAPRRASVQAWSTSGTTPAPVTAPVPSAARRASAHVWPLAASDVPMAHNPLMVHPDGIGTSVGAYSTFGSSRMPVAAPMPDPDVILEEPVVPRRAPRPVPAEPPIASPVWSATTTTLLDTLDALLRDSRRAVKDVQSDLDDMVTEQLHLGERLAHFRGSLHDLLEWEVQSTQVAVAALGSVSKVRRGPLERLRRGSNQGESAFGKPMPRAMSTPAPDSRDANGGGRGR
ncbi:hypothetical protein AMAG_03245 [Allomyces macrogynus ATCC 38327]|uniref:Uncharacterized protein n=1 Tax=Allomyces macrogynus (strain ATCC 38327) TaxID=578462 RepID=A0A0L0S5B0_ALLM3|nr:hypothetical protein AMAG_03245 [Allomyces macrogynus ATCC 38327]|eukprot:KNE57544.1 hypothetical protein AMAG_03245 [Allomyces macrogynus ATCC 38327]